MSIDVPRPPLGAVAKAGAVATLAAVIATVIASRILVALLAISPAFEPLGIPAVAIITAFYAVAAAVVYGIVARRAAHPRRMFIRIAIVAFVLLLIPDAMLLLNPGMMPFEGASTVAVLALIALHVVAAPIIVVLLLRLAPLPD